jgi:hypothetical protein
MRPALGTLSLAAILALSANPAAAALRIDSGETIHATLASADINTKNAQVGQTFELQLSSPYPGGHAGLAGATVYGHVSQVRSAGQGRTAQLALSFDRIVLPNGESAPLQATVTSLNEQKDNTTARKALGAGAGAAVGSQTVGRILGGSLGSVVGLVGGAAGGYAYAKNNKPNFDVPAGSAVTFTTTAPLLVERRQAR